MKESKGELLFIEPICHGKEGFIRIGQGNSMIYLSAY